LAQISISISQNFKIFLTSQIDKISLYLKRKSSFKNVLFFQKSNLLNILKITVLKKYNLQFSNGLFSFFIAEKN